MVLSINSTKHFIYVCRGTASDAFRLLNKMKHLSFIALFFYLASLLPVAQFSAVHNWLDLPQSSPVHSVLQLTSATKPVKHVDLLGDSDKAIVQLHQAKVVSAVFLVCQCVLAAVHAITTLFFSARAPPFHLS